MRKIIELGDSQELSRVTQLMHSKGIPTYSRSCWGRNGGSPWIVYACLDSQGDDAIKVLGNPDYEVSNPVDPDDFDRAAYSSNKGLILGWSFGIVVLVVTFLALALYLLKIPVMRT